MMEWWHEYLHACVRSRIASFPGSCAWAQEPGNEARSRKANPERTAHLRLPFRGLDNWHKNC